MWVVSSESCAFLTDTQYVREVQPGEIVEITRKGFRTVDVVELPADRQLGFCIFEYVYFAKGHSIFEGQVRLLFVTSKPVCCCRCCASFHSADLMIYCLR